MDVDTLLYAARCSVGTALLLSAGWKITHQRDFRVAYRASAPRRLQSFAAEATYVVAAVESVVGLGLFVPSPVGQMSALVALAVVAAFTVALRRTSEATGCGCWTVHAGQLEASVGSRTLLARNGILGGLALIGALGAGGAPPAAMAASWTTGALIAVIVMELPEIVSVATVARS